MTQYMVATSISEADEIARGNQMFIFRGANFKYGVGDTITFLPYSHGKPVGHPIERKKFDITYVSTEAPVEEGWKVIGFRRA